ncbi:MAG: type II toxin-antitoxin system prevent-host-death family antitoxin [Trueperaceae bacterium]|nr:MAG: type II toxin-antitoxin system prevent-host-death family antitoxin [Trueperaceae bacterium]
MRTLQLHEAKARLSELVEAALNGEEIIISRHGKPVAKLVGLAKPGCRELGFYPIRFESNLLEPTDSELIEAFYKQE